MAEKKTEMKNIRNLGIIDYNCTPMKNPTERNL